MNEAPEKPVIPKWSWFILICAVALAILAMAYGWKG